MNEISRALAWLKDGDHVFVAITPLPRRPGEPRTAVTALIQALYDRFSSDARRVLRNRIFTNAPLTEMCRGMVKVAAKRAGLLDHAESPMQMPADTPVDVVLSRLRELGDVERVGFTSVRERPLIAGKEVSAILLDASGQVLASAFNTNALNRTLHAEVNLVQDYFTRTGLPIPRGATIQVSLKPCKMCAGMIWECAEDPSSIRVVYEEDDPGPHARDTVLDPFGNARRRAAQARGRPEWLGLEIQKKADP